MDSQLSEAELQVASLLVLATFGFVCFGAIFFLPGANEIPSSQNKV